jgi:hypothetical protein
VTCKTPRRNKDLDARLLGTQYSRLFFSVISRRKSWVRRHNPVNTGLATGGCGLSLTTPNQICCPIVPLMEDQAVLFLSEENRGISEATAHLFTHRVSWSRTNLNRGSDHCAPVPAHDAVQVGVQ